MIILGDGDYRGTVYITLLAWKGMTTNQIIQNKGQIHYLLLVTNQNIQLKGQDEPSWLVLYNPYRSNHRRQV